MAVESDKVGNRYSLPASTGLLVLLGVVAFVLRVWAGGDVVHEDRIVLRDPDTLRRLVRLENLADPQNPYPYRNLEEGWPEGSVIHWTLPMDGLILTLDSLLGAQYPQARKYEAGALWVGPVLGVLTVLAFSLLAVRWLGLVAGGAAALVYSLTLSGIASSVPGLGDHQALLLLCVAVAVTGFLAVVDGRARAPTAILVGLALGLGLWTSAELMIVCYVLALGCLLSLLLQSEADLASALHRHQAWALAGLIVCLLATRIENPDHWWVFEWDRVSHFHCWQLGVFLLFLVLVQPISSRMKGKPWKHVSLAAVAALLLGVTPLLFASARSALAGQLQLAREVNQWTQIAVNEFRPLFMYRDLFYIEQAHDLLGATVYLLPLAMIGVLFGRRHSGTLRAPLILITVAFLALGCWEVRLLPLVGIVFPLALAVGGGWWIDVLRSLPRAPKWSPVALAATILAVHAGPTLFVIARCSSAEPLEVTPEEHLASWFDEQLDREGRDGSILAPWGLSATLMYHARGRVVSSGYHRNLEGILDGYRFLVTEDAEEAARILERRNVRWIVCTSALSFLTEAEEVLGCGNRHFRVRGTTHVRRPEGGLRRQLDIQWHPSVRRTMFWNLSRLQEALPDKRLFSRLRQVYPATTVENPLFRVYRVDSGD